MRIQLKKLDENKEESKVPGLKATHAKIQQSKGDPDDAAVTPSGADGLTPVVKSTVDSQVKVSPGAKGKGEAAAVSSAVKNNNSKK